MNALSYFDDDAWFKMKWTAVGFAVGYIAKSFFGILLRVDSFVATLR